jgi:hypothetical protein
VRGRPAAWAAVLAVVLVGAGGQAWADESPAERSREATGRLDFTGRVRVQWVDAIGRHETTLDVRVADGVISVQGPRAVLAERHERLVRDGGAGWRLVWQAGVPAGGVPDVSRAYRVQTGFGPVVAGRLTRTVRITKQGWLRERLFVDAGTGLILRREQYDARGAVRRVVTFERIRPGAEPVAHPVGAHDRAPKPVSAAPAHPVFRAPARLAGGYVRIGTYRRGDAVWVLYSDGVYGLSLFEQRGRLAGGRPGAGARPVPIGRGIGWHLVAPSGEVVLWQAGEAVYAVVGEAPAEEVLAAARSVPWPPGPSLIDRIRRACRGLLDV